MAEFKLPTEQVDLPSKGLLYPKDSPLAEGKIEMKYMTAKEEDILTNQNYITKGVVVDKLLEWNNKGLGRPKICLKIWTVIPLIKILQKRLFDQIMIKKNSQ